MCASGYRFSSRCGELAGVPTPLARAFLSIGGAICGEDFMKTGRTLQSLGVGGLGRSVLQAVLATGMR